MTKWNAAPGGIYSFSNKTPGLREPFQTPGGICRAGGRQADRRPADDRFRVFFIHFCGSFPVDIDSPDRSAVKDNGQVARGDVADAGVGGAGDPAGVNDIPERKSVVEDEVLFLRDIGGDIGVVEGGYQFPEPILWVAVKEALFPRFDRGKAAKDECLRFAVEQRGNGMVCDHLVYRIPWMIGISMP